MKSKLFALLVFSFSLWGAEPKVVNFDKLQHRGWLTYITNQDTPFTGRAVSFYANGQKRQEASYKDGKYDGLWSWWYENGQKSREENYEDGNENGFHPRWYENGQMRGEVRWKNGKHDGLWTWKKDPTSRTLLDALHVALAFFPYEKMVTLTPFGNPQALTL